MIRTTRPYLLISILLLLLAERSPAQDWADREYGTGLVAFRTYSEGPPGTSSGGILLSFYSNPSERSSKVAVLRSDSLTLVTTGESFSLYQRALEYGYEEVGFPILEFTADSSWVRVSLDCWDMKNSSTAWLPISSQDLRVFSWTDILGRADAFFFLRERWIQFYSSSDTTTPVDIQLASRYARPNYSMYLKQLRGDWMQVEVETPSSYCYSEEEVLEMFGVRPRKKTVWIRFLDERGRPRIFFNTRGC